jgi:hypothetical protein
MVARTNVVRVVGAADEPREGLYRMSGTLLDVPVEVTLELYVAEAGRDSTDVSAFVLGNWVGGPIDRSADGVFRGDTLALTIYQVVTDAPGDVSAFLVAGPTSAGAASSLTVYDRGLNVVGTLSLERPAAGSARDR